MKHVNVLNFSMALWMATILGINVAYSNDFIWETQAAETGLTNPSQIISTNLGQTHINFNTSLVNDLNMDIRINGHSSEALETPRAMWGDIHTFDILPGAGLDLLAPHGHFDDFIAGSLVHQGGFIIELPHTRINAQGFVIQVGAKNPRELELIDLNGNALFVLKTPRVMIDAVQAHMQAVEMDLQISSYLANRLQNPRLAGLPIGTAALTTNLIIPDQAAMTTIEGGICTGRPFWPTTTSELIDVGFTNITAVYKRRRADGMGGFEAMFAPSSSLINLADGALGADVPWYGFYSGSFDPYANSQHPYLVWSLYRIMNGRIEQIGRSGMKHAFLTVNVGCNNCGSNHILWPQCQDTYSSSNNDSNYYLGPRTELEANDGIFVESPSFFDPGGIGSHTNSSSDWENRLIVNEVDLAIPGAQYIFDSWYLVRDDINIFNTMGYRFVDFNFSGSIWQINHLSAQTLIGSVMDSWVTGSANEDTVAINDDQGHLRIDVKVGDLGAGVYHYEYALTNFDYDPKIKSMKFLIPTNSNLHNVGFSAPQGHFNADALRYQAANWNISHIGHELVFETNDSAQMLDWGGLYNFYFDLDVAPELTTISLQSGEILNDIDQNILGPTFEDDIIFKDGFE